MPRVESSATAHHPGLGPGARLSLGTSCSGPSGRLRFCRALRPKLPISSLSSRPVSMAIRLTTTASRCVPPPWCSLLRPTSTSTSSPSIDSSASLALVRSYVPSATGESAPRVSRPCRSRVLTVRDLARFQHGEGPFG